MEESRKQFREKGNKFGKTDFCNGNGSFGFRNASREFVVLRVHKGKVSVLEDLDSATNTVTFKTDRFSTYALAYRTAAALTTRQTNSTKNTSVIGTLATNPSPATGDTAPLLPIAIVFLGSLSGILITMVLRRKM